MPHKPEPTPSNAVHRLHEGRRALVRNQFYEHVTQDKSLKLHDAEGVNLAAWHQMCGRIFDVVFDRNDFFQQIGPQEGQRRTEDILRDMREVGLAEPLAIAEYQKIAQHATNATMTIHAATGQRAALHRAQQPDANGKWRNPNGKFAPHYQPGIEQTVGDLIEDAQGHALGRKVLRERFTPMFHLMDRELSTHFWRNSTSLAQLTEYGKSAGGFQRHMVTQAVIIDLLDKYPSLATPLIGEQKPDAPRPKHIIREVTKSGLYNVALRNALYENLHTRIKEAYAMEMKDFRDLSVMDAGTMYMLQEQVTARVESSLNVYKSIAEQNFFDSELLRFEAGVKASFDAAAKGFEQYIDSIKEAGRQGPQR